MENTEFAAALRELADILEFEDADAPRVVAYRKAAEALEGWADDIEALAREGRLETVPGVGPAIGRLIGELARTGRLPALEEARDRLPPGVRDLMALPGVGPRRAARLLTALRVASLPDLERALREGRLSAAGLGAAEQEAVARGLELARLGVGGMPLGRALPRARAIAERLAALPDVLRVRVAGEARRGRRVVGEIALAAASGAPEALLATFRDAPQVRLVLPAPAAAAARVALDEGVAVTLYAGLPAAFGTALWRATGSARHLAQVEAALSRGRRGERPVPDVEEEADLYAAARLAFVPPELREGRGEVEAAREGRLPRLVEPEEVEGDLRAQSDWAGGAHPPERLAAAAAAAGLRWLAVVDPARGPRRPSGLDGAAARRRAAAIDAWNASPGAPCRLVAGVEAPIAEAGRLEGDPDALAAADLRIAVLDATGPFAARSRAERTAAAVRALLDGEADLLGLAPDPAPARAAGGDAAPPPPEGPRPLAAWVDLGAILAAAASAGAALLVPAHAAGGLLGPADLRRAAALGVPLALGTGARAVQELWAIEIGVALARRAGLGPGALLNARGSAGLAAWLAARRRR
jgi:DNA polymerase (family X)